ncbi:Arc family DNA-binding protein [Novosphingobium sp. HII-3]|uniref:Arc family DNA-binding protein n=1 Tax=Novosphingobium sp. HII-3 TaxID=2075565 RepID=UPI003511567A
MHHGGVDSNAPPWFNSLAPRWCKEEIMSTHPQFKLRVPPDLRDFIRASAERNQRSLNGELVFALRQYEKANEKGA